MKNLCKEFKEGQMLRNKYISGKHFRFIGMHPDITDRVVVEDNGREVNFYANDMEVI